MLLFYHHAGHSILSRCITECSKTRRSMDSEATFFGLSIINLLLCFFISTYFFIVQYLTHVFEDSIRMGMEIGMKGGCGGDGVFEIAFWAFEHYTVYY